MSQHEMVELGTLIQQAKTVRCGSDDYPVLSMTMHDGLVFQDDKFKKIIASRDRSDYKVVKRNQLVISFPIDEGVLATQRIVDAGIVSPAYGVWDVDQEKILPEFLEYALRCDRALSYYKAKLRGSTARRRSLPTPTLLAFTVPLPGVSEQQFVLDVIHKVKQIIDNRLEEIQQLDNLIKARFVELFGDPEKNTFSWKEEALSEHLTVICGYAFKSEHFSEEGIPVLRIGNINSGYFKPINLVYWEDDNALSRYKMYPGDLVMSLTGTVGKDDYGNVCILGNDYEVYYLNQRNAKLELHGTLNKYYLAMLLKFESVKKKLTGISRGVRQANISNKDILNLTVPIPPMELQKQFAAFVEQTDKSKVVVQKALNEAQTLFDGLMQEYFG
ncbi:MAG: restriction endonuclease subunit S [Christensenellales bacterium]